MSDLLFKICGVALVSSMLTAAIRKGSAELSVVLKIVAGVILAAASIGMISPVIEFIRSLSAVGNDKTAEYAEFMLRILCIAFLTHICATVCRDCGEGSLGGYVELGGKAEILVLTLPYISSIIDTALELI